MKLSASYMAPLRHVCRNRNGCGVEGLGSRLGTLRVMGRRREEKEGWVCRLGVWRWVVDAMGREPLL